MDKDHRRIILDNIGELIKLTNYKILLLKCLDRKIIFPIMELEIEKLQSGNETKHKLLFEKITRCGPNTFRELLEICKTDFTAAAALLQSKSLTFKEEVPSNDKEISIRLERKNEKRVKDESGITISYSETSILSGANIDIIGESVNWPDTENSLTLELSSMKKVPSCHVDDREVTLPQDDLIEKRTETEVIRDEPYEAGLSKLIQNAEQSNADANDKLVSEDIIEYPLQLKYPTNDKEINRPQERKNQNEVKKKIISPSERSLSNSEQLGASNVIIEKSTAVPTIDSDDRKISSPQEQMIGKGAKRKIIKNKPVDKQENGGPAQMILESSMAAIDITGESTNDIDNASALPLKSHIENLHFTKYSYVELSLREERMKQNEAKKKTIKEKSYQGVPCYGCGALLHCGVSSFPGYLPLQLFEVKNKQLLKTIPCQRCNFLKNYNTVVDIRMLPGPYIEIISTMRKNKSSLAIVMVDLLDFPCSLSLDFASIVGTERPVFLVGNKVDLLPRESHKCFNHIEKCLENYVASGIAKMNIKHVCLISAQTGYGVEELITNLHNVWEYKGDVYLLGCTNVGKTSLFNALLRSDYCEVQASNIIRKATVSPWPNTTIRSLKFPILRPSPKLLYKRIPRLLSEESEKAAKAKSRADQSNMANVEDAKLIGHIGQTFAMSTSDITLNTEDTSRWCYDTPSTSNDESILSLLTMEEIQEVVPKTMIKSRALLLTPGMSIFLAGVARIDYLNGLDSIRCTVYSSTKLPLSIVKIEKAVFKYNEWLNTGQLIVPMSNHEDRLRIWPDLQFADIFTFKGEGIEASTCDIMLSSVGWVALNIPENDEVTFKVWTPQAKGICIRKPSFIQ